MVNRYNADATAIADVPDTPSDPSQISQSLPQEGFVENCRGSICKPPFLVGVTRLRINSGPDEFDLIHDETLQNPQLREPSEWKSGQVSENTRICRTRVSL